MATFSIYDKIVPDVYDQTIVNFDKLPVSLLEGVVAIPLELPWGKDKITSVTKTTNTFKTFGILTNDKAFLPVTEALKNCNKVLVYRLNGNGDVATGKIGTTVSVKAVCSGILGNDITVSVIDIPNSKVTTKQVFVVTYVKNIEVDKQRISDVSEFVNKGFIILEELSPRTDKSIKLLPVETSGVQLKGGTDGVVTVGDYVDFFENITSETFDIIALPLKNGDDIKEYASNWVVTVDEKYGLKTQIVVSNYNAKNYRIINVVNGVILKNGTEVTTEDATGYVAGLCASLPLNASISYHNYKDAKDVYLPFSLDEVAESILNGEVCFLKGTEGVVINDDINSLTSVDSQNTLSNNKAVRVRNSFCKFVTNVWKTRYISQPNTEQNRQSFKNTVRDFMNTWYENNIIQQVLDEDVEVFQIENNDFAIGLNVRLKIYGSLKILYLTMSL